MVKSFMKVFGYESKEIRRLYLNASTFTVMISLILCLPLEIQVMKALLVYAMSDIEGYFRKVNRIRMGDALKNRE